MADYQLKDWAGGQQVLNTKRIVILQHTGPTSYTAITPGTPPAAPTGGDSITAAGCGLQSIEAVIVLGDSAGKYSGHAFNPQVSKTGLLAGTGAAVKTVPLMWITAATGAELAGATDLSAAMLNIMVVGN